jgi:hypothetical protein
MLKKLIRKAKTDYYGNKFSMYRNDIKNTWVTIKEIINKNKMKPSIPDYFSIRDEHVSNKDQIVNEFNTYFANIGPELASKISPPSDKHFYDNLQNPISNNFIFQNISETTVNKTIDSLKAKSTTGNDRLSSVILKKIKAPLIKPISYLINQSLNSGIFPNSLKIAKIKPIYKKENVHMLNNYRPICYQLFQKFLNK